MSGALGVRARSTRLLATGAVLALLFAGTVWGVDDDFPVGPFRMYSTRGDPDGTVRELRVRVVLQSGEIRDVTDTAGAPRRAELEGRLSELLVGDAALHKLVPLYTRQFGDAARTLQLVWENHPLHNGRSGPATFTVLRTVPA